MANRVPFLPIRGLEKNILSNNPIDGGIWFATDTRKIYYSDGSNFISMGGNSGVYYGQMVLSETPDDGQTEFDFVPEDIEGNENVLDDNYIIPNENDLIFNTPDNSFYRVLDVFEDTNHAIIIHTKLLTVAGGGGGGSQGGGGSSSNTGIMRFDRITQSSITVLQGAPCLLGFRFSAVDASGDATGNGTATITVNGIRRATQSVTQGENYIDVSQYLDADSQLVQIAIEASTGGATNEIQRKNWTVNKVRLSVNWNYNDTTVQTGDNVLLTYSVSTTISHQVHIIIDDIYEALPPVGNSTVTQNYLLSKSYGLTHGAHKVEMYVTANINNTDITSQSVFHTIIYADADNTSPIIGFANYTNTMQQYDTMLIPVIIYDPNSTSGYTTAILREDGNDKDTWEIINGSSNIWSYTPMTAGIHRLLVVCGGSEIYQDIIVKELEIDIEEIPNYEFKFSASDFISNNTVQTWNSNGVTANFSDNFDWHNGGLKTEEVENGMRSYFCVKAGTTMTIHARPFDNISANIGKTIKFIFKATNCRDYDAQVLECYQRYSDTDARGLLVNAQNAQISCSASSLNVPYCEDSYIELEMDVWDGQLTKSGNKQNYLMVWVDGIPAGVKLYADGTAFNNDHEITIGSKDCDVYVYMLKSYNRHLSEDDHLRNFIADSYNASEMISRYRRNDILGENGDISYTKMALANPNVKLHLYDIPRMTAAKKDEVKECSYQQFYGSTEAEVSATNVSIQGQGTSSSAYGMSAFNIDSKFYDGFNYSDGTTSKKYSMTSSSIGANYFNTKVNVASCEGANNALNQEWYNRWQPYVCEYKAKNAEREDGKLARDTMEFPYPGVMFVKDNNPNSTRETAVENNCFSDTEGYIENPYYKMYAICNMGNSKKNKDVFHDTKNPYECCIEINDNQRPEQWMTDISTVNPDNIEAPVYVDEKGKGQSVFEFRYIPEDDSEDNAANIKMFSNAWYRFINWMSSNNPEKATGEELPEPVTYGDYTFKGYVSDKTGYTPENQILKGTKVTTYNGTYTHDTKKYRMAKMLNECEDYIIMDALVYHYLMIERHTLIDNVAKNTFWTTEDLVHWCCIKDYDNDTSDGNDNQGALTLTYGYEVLDKVTGTDRNVFNATPSVWLHFIDGLYQARQTMYLALDTRDANGASAWDAETYLKMFQDYQDAIPERCWIADYHKKYLRPYEVYGEQRYLAMLEGGKKTHQRRQYEIYQQTYMASEYGGSDCKQSMIEIRGNNAPAGFEVGDLDLTITMYSDCYINAAIGSGHDINVSQRVKRNIPTVIHITNENLNNATIYFYSANNITAMDGIYKLFTEVAAFAAASRLRELQLGSGLPGYSNTNLTSVQFSANKMLEKLNIQNCPNVKIPLDLQQLSSLKELNTQGSGFTQLIIGSNAPVEKLELNAINQLQLNNLYNLQELSLDSYNNIGQLFINNIDESQVNSKDIVANALASSSSFSEYMLNNVKWTISESSELEDDASRNDIIKILNALLEPGRSPRKLVNGNIEQSTREQALTGVLDITEEAYSGNKSLEVYNYYAFNDGTDFPGLDINFEGNAKLFNVTIQNGQGQKIWTKKLAANSSINEDFLSSGPDGNFYNLIIDDYQDTAHTYSFKNSWTLRIGENEPIIIEGEAPIYNHTISDDIIITPMYESTTRQYMITFIVNGIEYTQEAGYGTSIIDIANEKFPNGVYKSDEDLPVASTYNFIGWSLVENSQNILSNDITIGGVMTLYACFEIVDVHNNIHPELFSYRVVEDGVLIYPINPLALQGKITIPKIIDNYTVTQLSDFNQCAELTHVFFERGTLVNQINASCFRNTSGSNYNVNKLCYIEPIPSLKVVGNSAFAGTHLRIDLDDKDYVVGGSSLVQIDRNAYQNAFVSETAGRYLIIPSTVTTISSFAFGWEDNMPNCIIQLGTEENPSQWDAQINNGLNNTEDEGHRFSQNDCGISLNFYSSKYSSLNDIIPPREYYSQETGLSLERAIHDVNSKLNINFVHVN